MIVGCGRKSHLSILAIVIFVGVLICGSAFAAGADQVGTDFIFLLDNGYSMNRSDNPTDPNGYRFDATAIALSLLGSENLHSNYVLFNQNVQVFNGKGLETINPKQSLAIYDVSLSLGRSRRLQMLNDLMDAHLCRSKNSSGSTDIGQALDKAVEALLRDNNGNKKVIVLLTDGGIYFVRNNDLTEWQRNKQYTTSNDLAIGAHNKAEENGITIHTILLGDVSATSFMQDEIRTTDGLFFMAAEASELPDIITRIYAHDKNTAVLATSGTANDNGSMTFSVPNGSATCLNIVVPVSHINTSSLELVSPSGEIFNDITKPDFYYVVSNQYAIYKIMNPAEGNWKLTYHGDNSANQITARYILDYDLDLLANVSATQASKADSITISAQYQRNGNPVLNDNSLYTIPATIELVRDGAVVKKVSMEGTDSGYSYTFDTLKTIGAGDYTVNIKTDGAGLIREFTGMSFTLLNQAPVLSAKENLEDKHTFTINIPGVETSYAIQNYTWNLTEYVVDPDGDGMVFSVISAPEGITTSIVNSSLTVSTIKDTEVSGDIIVSTADKDGLVGPELTFHVDVVSAAKEVGTIVYGPTQPLTKLNDSTTIRVQYTINGTTSTNTEYYNIPATVTLKKDEKVIKSGLAMEYNGMEYTYTFDDLKQYGAGTFVAEVRLQSGSFVLDCSPISISLENGAPQLAEDHTASIEHEFDINIPGDQNSYQPQTWTIDLGELIVEPDGDKLVWKIEPFDVSIKASISNGELKVTTQKNTPTSGKIAVTVKDEDGAIGPTLYFDIKVISIEDVYNLYEARMKPLSGNKNSDVDIVLTVYNEDGKKVVNDSYLPDNCTAKVIVGENENSVTLIRQDNGEYTGKFHTAQSETEYSVIASVSVGGKTIESSPVSFKTINKSPVVVQDIAQETSQTFYLGISDDITVFIGRVFSDPDGDFLSYAVEHLDASDKLTATIDGETLTIHAIAANFCMPTDVSFVVTAYDSEGGNVSINAITITIWPVFVQVVITVIVILIAIAVIIFIRWKNAHYGNVAFDVSYGYQGLELPDTISDPLPQGGHQAVSLGNYYTDLARNACEQQISLDSVQKLIIKPLAGDKIRVTVPSGLVVHVHANTDATFDISNQRYSSKNEITKACVLKVGDCITICRDDCRVSFKLIHIRQADSN